MITESKSIPSYRIFVILGGATVCGLLMWLGLFLQETRVLVILILLFVYLLWESVDQYFAREVAELSDFHKTPEETDLIVGLMTVVTTLGFAPSAIFFAIRYVVNTNGTEVSMLISLYFFASVVASMAYAKGFALLRRIEYL